MANIYTDTGVMGASMHAPENLIDLRSIPVARDPQVKAAVGDIEVVIKGLYESIDQLGSRLAPILSGPVPMESQSEKQREGGCQLGNHLLMLANELQNLRNKVNDIANRVEV